MTTLTAMRTALRELITREINRRAWEGLYTHFLGEGHSPGEAEKLTDELFINEAAVEARKAGIIS